MTDEQAYAFINLYNRLLRMDVPSDLHTRLRILETTIGPVKMKYVKPDNAAFAGRLEVWCKEFKINIHLAVSNTISGPNDKFIRLRYRRERITKILITEVVKDYDLMDELLITSTLMSY